MLRVDEAREEILRHAPARRMGLVPLESALGQILGEDLVAPEPLPSFARSGMDGYALRSIDTAGATREEPAVLPLSGLIPAGRPMAEALRPLTCASIMTGAAIPVGADAVIRMEEVRVTPEGIRIFRPVQAGENIAPIGEDVAEGQIVLRQGHKIRAAEINLLAAIGVDQVPVYLAPRVGILATGDELVAVGEPLGPGKIRNSNGPSMAAMVRSAGGIPVPLGIAHDAADLIAGAISHSTDCDIILTSGGVSVGEFDVVKETLAVMGAKQLFWRVAIKPGMPVCAAMLEGRMVIGLSGNPAALITNFDLLVKPLLDHLCGREQIGMREVEAVLDQPVLRVVPMTRFLRARIYLGTGGELRADTDMAQRAGVLSSMVHANAYVEVPAQTGPLASGERVKVLLHDDVCLVAPSRISARA